MGGTNEGFYDYLSGSHFRMKTVLGCKDLSQMVTINLHIGLPLS